MSERHERRLFEIVDEVNHSDTPMALEALTEITAMGKSNDGLPGDFVVIGGAVTSEYHYPMPAMKAFEPDEESVDPYWELRLRGESANPGISILRGSIVARTAIHTALGGNINVINERLVLGELLTTSDDIYLGPTYGWDPDEEGGENYTLAMHRAYETETRNISDKAVIGFGDIVSSERFGIKIPREPGHFASGAIETRIASIPITMGDARLNLANAAITAAIRHIEYPPQDPRGKS